MDKLTPNELMALSTLPPYIMAWDDLIVKHWGRYPPEHIYDFLTDVRQVQDNLMMLQSKRDKEEEEDEESDRQVCTKCTAVRGSVVDAIKMHIDHLSTASKHLIFEFFQLQRELRGNRGIYILEDQLDKTLDEIDTLCDLASKLKELVSNENETNQMSQE